MDSQKFLPSEEIPLHKRETWRYFKQAPYPLFVGVLLLEIAYGIFFFPLAQVYLPDDVGLSIGIAGYLMSTYGLFRFLSQLPAGWLVDKVSFRVATAISVALILMATGLLLTAESTMRALGAAALYGLGIATLWPTIYAALADSYEISGRGKVTGMLNIAVVGGTVIGAVAGAILVGHFGFPISFRICFAFDVAALILFNLWKKPRAFPEPRGGLNLPRLQVPTIKALLAPRVLLFALLILALSLSSNFIAPVVRSYGKEVLNLEFHQLALFALPLGLVWGAMLVGTGSLVDRLGRSPMLLTGLVTLMISLALLGHTTDHRFVPWIALLAVAGASFILPSWGAAAMDLSRQGSRGRLLGIVMSMQGAGETIGPAVGGRFNELYGPLAVINLSAAALAMAVLICLGYAIARP